MHIEATEPMHYALCSMHPLSLRPVLGPMPNLCSIRFMHNYIMRYENFYCTGKSMDLVIRLKWGASNLAVFGWRVGVALANRVPLQVET